MIVSEPLSTPSGSPHPRPAVADMPASAGAAGSAHFGGVSLVRIGLVAGGLLAVMSVAALTLALLAQQRVETLEHELVRRQQDSQGQAVAARAMAKQSLDTAMTAETRIGLLEGRVAETALQRTQLEELIQQLSRSRDENVLADVEAAIRVSIQQVAITGSAEPLLGALRQAEERLSRMSQPRLERVRRSISRDIDRVKAVALTDIASLVIKLDEAVRLADEMPLLSQPERRAATSATPSKAAASATMTATTTTTTSMVTKGAPFGLDGTAWWQPVSLGWTTFSDRVVAEVRGLVRVTRIDQPEAMLASPEQTWFLRENLKLRLLNARLALLSRQYDTVQSDLRDVQTATERYFDRSSRRVMASAELVKQVAQQARQMGVPRPDETLAAIAAVQAGR